MKILSVVMAMAALMSLVDSQATQAQSDASKPEFYTQQVQPIFAAHCTRCHGDSNHRGGLSLGSRQDMLLDRRNKPVIIPGDAANSLLVRLIRHEGPPNDPMPMPSKRERLSDADIAIVERWVLAGAIVPATLTGGK
jgi:cytochrome c